MELTNFVIGLGIGGLISIAVFFVFVRPVMHARQRRRADSIHAKQQDLTNLYNELSDKMERDPARLGIDVGKEYVTNKVQTVLNEVREELKS